MPFFLPSRLIDFEYFSGETQDKDYIEEAKPYRNDMDFAFFAANFGYSKADYEALTPREISFLYKAYENKTVSLSYLIYNAVFTAFYNVNRPKRKRALKLWKKIRMRKTDKKTAEENIRIVEESDKNDGNWIERLYRENRMKMPKGG